MKFEAFKQQLVPQGKTEGTAEGRAEGKAEGKAEGLLRVLAGRGLSITAEQRDYILTCRDRVTLDRMLQPAAVAPSTDQVLH